VRIGFLRVEGKKMVLGVRAHRVFEGGGKENGAWSSD